MHIHFSTVFCGKVRKIVDNFLTTARKAEPFRQKIEKNGFPLVENSVDSVENPQTFNMNMHWAFSQLYIKQYSNIRFACTADKR